MLIEPINLQNVSFLKLWLKDIQKNPEKWTPWQFLAELPSGVFEVVTLKCRRTKLVTVLTASYQPYRVHDLIGLSLIKRKSKDPDPFNFME